MARRSSTRARRAPGRTGRIRSLAAGVLLALTASQAVAPAAAAAAGDIGFEGPSYTGAGTAPTGSKPESKLWFNDGTWWGTLWSASPPGFHIFRLDLAGKQWIDTGLAVDTRTGTRDDVLWDGTKLYIASHKYSTSPAPGYPVYLYRYSYVAASKTYTLDSGFPAQIHDSKTETFVIDKDSTGTLWATWVQNQQVYVSHSTTSDSTWTTPYVLPVTGTSVNADDISSVIAFRHPGDPNRIGVMWSNQNDDKVHFAFHNDGDPDTTWDDSKTALQGNNYADDHINLKSLQSDGSGRIYAAVKTSLSTSSAPLIMLLTFTPSTMTWTSTPVARVSDGHTRPIVMVDQEHAIAHVYMTGPVPPATSGDSGGAIYEKASPLSNLSFPLGLGTAVIQDADSPAMNNVTSTKQNVTSASGLVLLASNDSTNRYWWQFDPLGGTPPPVDPPVADFTASPTSGPAPLAVQFTDQSTNLPTSWAWDFDDNGTVDSTAENPTFTYTTPGTYSVSLQATNSGGTGSTTKTSLITVGQPLSFTTVTPSADAFVNQGQPTKNYGTDPTLRVRQSANSYRSYVKFTVPDPGGTVRSVKLRLWVTDASPDGGSVYSVANSWTESGTGSITWNTAPPLPGSSIKAIGATILGTWEEIDLGPVIGGAGTYSFAIASSSGNSAYYSSREGAHAPELVIGVDSGQPPPPAPPVAAFTATPTSGNAPLLVQFTDQSTNVPTSWAWDFDNDGTVDSTAQNPTFTYQTAGSYSVKLTVANNDGSDSLTKTNFISVGVAPPPPPTTTFTAIADTRVSQASPTSKTGGTDVSLRVRLDATGSYHTYVRFNVTGLSGTVTSAKLRLWCTDASPNGGTAYPTSTAWDEATTSWSNAPAATGGALGSSGAVAVGAWAEFDVTALVAGNGQVDLLVADGDSNSAYYSSREGTAAPELVVTTSP